MSAPTDRAAKRWRLLQHPAPQHRPKRVLRRFCFRNVAAPGHFERDAAEEPLHDAEPATGVDENSGAGAEEPVHCTV